MDKLLNYQEWLNESCDEFQYSDDIVMLVNEYVKYRDKWHRDNVPPDVEQSARTYANEIVFEKNGHLFSNNNDEAGNAVKVCVKSFKAGYSLRPALDIETLRDGFDTLIMTKTGYDPKSYEMEMIFNFLRRV